MHAELIIKPGADIGMYWYTENFMVLVIQWSLVVCVSD